MKIKTRKLKSITPSQQYESGKLQIVRIYDNGDCLGLHNIYREKGGWVSDCYSGWYRTVTEWKTVTQRLLEK
jgi:hypothetical protein